MPARPALLLGPLFPPLHAVGPAPYTVLVCQHRPPFSAAAAGGDGRRAGKNKSTKSLDLESGGCFSKEELDCFIYIHSRESVNILRPTTDHLYKREKRELYIYSLHIYIRLVGFFCI